MYKENEKMKVCFTADYNFIFNKENGAFARWGATKEDDPTWSSLGPEIADIEVTTICRGPKGVLCSFCYKANNPKGRNMSFETFKTIFHKLPKNLTQIAFGADAQCESNPDIWKMMRYCRENGKNEVIPNITVADISDDTADKLVSVCGAVAVSRYEDKSICYDSVKKLADRGLTQTNIHVMISEETFEWAKQTIIDSKEDERLSGLNAIILLSLKRRGRGSKFTPLSMDKFKELIDLAFELKAPIGFDSCSAPKFLKAVKDKENYKQLEMCSEPCESSLFSIYINVDGIFYPCSFCEGRPSWTDGIDLTTVDDFFGELWQSERVSKFRNTLLTNLDDRGVRECPMFDV